MNETPEEQYLDACFRIILDGTWVKNARTGKRVKTVINLDMVYNCSQYEMPMLTTKKMAWKSAVAEMLGYLKGYNNAADFRALGTKTWDANSNAPIWQDSEHCKGPDDMGYCYGAVGSSFQLLDEDTYSGIGYYRNDSGIVFNQWLPIIDDLSNGIDNRREIVTFYHPGTMHLACLPPCVHTHTFSLLDGYLYLTSYQRSADMPLGVPFNMIQTAWLLYVVAHITGNKPGAVFHKIVNAHIYEDQIDIMKQQLTMQPLPAPTIEIDANMNTWNHIVEHASLSNFEILNYRSHPAITYPFSV